MKEKLNYCPEKFLNQNNSFFFFQCMKYFFPNLSILIFTSIFISQYLFPIHVYSFAKNIADLFICIFLFIQTCININTYVYMSRRELTKREMFYLIKQLEKLFLVSKMLYKYCYTNQCFLLFLIHFYITFYLYVLYQRDTCRIKNCNPKKFVRRKNF